MQNSQGFSQGVFLSQGISHIFHSIFTGFIHCTFITAFTVGVNLSFSCAELGALIQFITAESAGLIFDMAFRLHQVP